MNGAFVVLSPLSSDMAGGVFLPYNIPLIICLCYYILCTGGPCPPFDAVLDSTCCDPAQLAMADISSVPSMRDVRKESVVKRASNIKRHEELSV